MQKKTDKRKVIMFIIATVIIVLLLRKVSKILDPVKFDKMGNRIISESEIKSAFQKCSAVYGAEYARNVERLFRKETAHFTSGQFKKTLSPGMEISGGTNSTKTTFPFGWSSLEKFVNANPLILKSTFYVSRMNENGTGLGKTFVGFPTIDSSVMFVAWFIKNVRGGRFGKWYSTNESSALAYETGLSLIKARYV